MKSRSTISERIEYIDILKGFGMLMLLLSHSIAKISALKTWIFSFHMPLFFCCTGILIAAKNSDPQIIRIGLKKHIKEKIVSLIIPYVVFSTINVLFKEALLFLGTHQISMDRLCAGFVNIILLRGAESLWFLPCLLIAEILYVTILAYFPGYGCHIMTVICILVNMVFANALPEGFCGSIIRASTGLVFIHLGWCMYRSKLKNDRGLWIDFLMLTLGAGVSYINGFAAIGSYEFKSVSLYYTSAFCTLYAMINISKKLKGLQLTPYLGRNSIVILCTNNILIEILRLLDHKLTGDFFISHGLTGDILFAMLLTVLEIPIIIIGMTYFKPLFGVLKSKKGEIR